MTNEERYANRAAMLKANGKPVHSSAISLPFIDWALDTLMGYRCWYCGVLSELERLREEGKHQHAWSMNYDEPTFDTNPVTYSVRCDCGANGLQDEGAVEVYDVSTASQRAATEDDIANDIVVPEGGPHRPIHGIPYIVPSGRY